MKFIKIENREIVVELRPEECLRIAQLIDHSELPHDTGLGGEIAETYVAAFEAAALAGGATSYLQMSEIDQVTLARLRVGQMLDDLWTSLPGELEQLRGHAAD